MHKKINQVKDYSKIPELCPIPNLLDIQKISFVSFLQRFVPPDERKKQGLQPATIDLQINLVKTMVTKAFDNDLLGGSSLKAFRKIKRMLKRGANARKRIVSFEDISSCLIRQHLTLDRF